MADPAQIDLIADRRLPLEPHYSFIDVDWTASAFKAQVRAVKDTTGAPLIDDPSNANVLLLYAGTATVTAHIAAGRLPSDFTSLINPATGVEYVGTDAVLLSQLGFGIIAAIIAALPFPDERGDDLTAWYDVIRIPSVGDNELVMRGKFTVRAGVTIP